MRRDAAQLSCEGLRTLLDVGSYCLSVPIAAEQGRPAERQEVEPDYAVLEVFDFWVQLINRHIRQGVPRASPLL